MAEYYSNITVLVEADFWVTLDERSGASMSVNLSENKKDYAKEI